MAFGTSLAKRFSGGGATTVTLAKPFGDGEVTTVTLGGSTSAAPQQLARLGKLPGAHGGYGGQPDQSPHHSAPLARRSDAAARLVATT